MEQCEAKCAQRKSGEGCSQADCVEGKQTGDVVGREWNARKRLFERMRERIRAGNGKKKKKERNSCEEGEKTKEVCSSYTRPPGNRVYVKDYFILQAEWKRVVQRDCHGVG